jgi:hypothetical protein
MSGDDENSNVIYVNFMQDLFSEEEILTWIEGECWDEDDVLFRHANENRKVFD